jgi:hypothetical protein
MKTTNLYLIFIFIPFISFGQAKQSIDIIGGLDFYQTSGADGDDIEILEGFLSGRLLGEEDLDTLRALNGSQKGKFNWRVGINYNRRITGKLFVKSGLRVASLGFDKIVRTGLISITVDPDNLETSLGSSSVPSVNFTNNYWFLEIPVAIRIELGEKKFSSFFELGLSPTIYLTNRKNQESELDSRRFVDDQSHFDFFNQVHWVGFASFGFNYNLGEKLQIFAQPIFRYSITNLAEGNIIEERLFTAGLELGLRKKF